MDFLLTKELEMLRKAVREFATKRISPNADQWDYHHFRMIVTRTHHF